MSYYWAWNTRREISDLLGLTMKSVTEKDNEIEFEAIDGRCFVMAHDQDCCESVEIESIVGDLADLVGSPILSAEAPSSDGMSKKGEWDDSFTWTFYKLATIKGYVDIRWYGTSNGYYSEDVGIYERPSDQGAAQ